MYIYIYICVYRAAAISLFLTEGLSGTPVFFTFPKMPGHTCFPIRQNSLLFCGGPVTPNLPTNIVGFRGFDSSIILIIRGGILVSIRDFPESLSKAMFGGIMLVGRLGVQCYSTNNTNDNI